MRVTPLLLALAACSSGSDARPAPDPAPAPAPAPVAPDAAVATPPDPVVLPPMPGEPPVTRERRRLQIMLTSSPSGALAKVDGKVVGTTPAYWEGDFTGRPRTFTFEMPGHAIATYVFVPIQDGFVHGRLERVGDGIDAGAP